MSDIYKERVVKLLLYRRDWIQKTEKLVEDWLRILMSSLHQSIVKKIILISIFELVGGIMKEKMPYMI